MIELNNKILSDITVYMKYAKYIPELNRRETWEELVTRNKEMHQKRYPELYNQIEETYRYVYKKKFYQVCARFSSVVSQLKSVRIDYTIAATYLSIILIALVSVCSFCYLAAVLVIAFKNIILPLFHV